MSFYKIPINNAPNASYTFRISMQGDTVNRDIRIELHYLDLYDEWLMDVYDDATKKLLVLGIPLVCGIDLLGQYRYLGIGSAYILKVRNTDLMHPDNLCLGRDFVLVWGDNT